MTSNQRPLVTILTPVYNGEDFLAECIESVLAQSYQNYEYIIVNNCSTDHSLEIARSYAEKDARIRVCTNQKFVGVIENHNIAFRQASLAAKYCKVVSADDFLFPEYLRRVVELAEANPSVGIAGSYQLSGSEVRWQGFEYPKAVMSGRDVCRRIFLNGDPTFGCGSPTSLMYRADLVRKNDPFYPNPSPHSDTSACFSCLRDSAFGFVYEVLCYERKHEATQSSKSAKLDRYSSAYLNDLLQYGPFYLDKSELDGLVHAAVNRYYKSLAMEWVTGRQGKEFWNYHRERLAELGFPLTRAVLLKAAVVNVFRYGANPGLALGKLRRRLAARAL
jgi:glycosyltransferase involved in cell wall biosynthesis